MRRKIGDYDIYALDDGYDYWSLVERFRLGELSGSQVAGTSPKRKVFFIEHDGRTFVLKFAVNSHRSLESKLFAFLHGPLYARSMKKINRAIEAGCGVVQRIYLAAEKMRGGLSRESIIVAEFVPGTPLDKMADLSAYRSQVAGVVTEAHRYGLTVIDMHPGNFVATDEGLKLIDLTQRTSLAVGKARDLVRLRERWGVEVPARGLVERLLVFGAAIQSRLRRIADGKGDVKY